VRRALLPEAELAALRARCIDIGLVLAVRNDARGGCRIRIGDRSFGEFRHAVAHVEQLEAEEARR
jgi:hypothetical protein